MLQILIGLIYSTSLYVELQTLQIISKKSLVTPSTMLRALNFDGGK